MKAVWLEAYLSGVENAQLKLLRFQFLTLEWLFLSSMREDSNDFIICFLDFISHVIILLIRRSPPINICIHDSISGHSDFCLFFLKVHLSFSWIPIFLFLGSCHESSWMLRPPWHEVILLCLSTYP